MSNDQGDISQTTEAQDKWQEALRSGPHFVQTPNGWIVLVPDGTRMCPDVFPSLHEAQKAVGTYD